MKARFTANLNEKHAPVKAFTLKGLFRFHYNKGASVITFNRRLS